MMPESVFNFEQWATIRQTRVEQALEKHLPANTISPEQLHSAMRYAILGGGKRVRPLLAYAAAEFCGGDIAQVDVPAIAVELIHAFSLVHDDMPCMDDDDLRRGKPSTHKQFNDATALLAGDALQSLAFELLASDDYEIDALQKVKMLHLLAFATGSRGMAGGQSIDLESTGIQLSRAALENMHQLKTGAIIHAAMMLGAYSVNKVNSVKIEHIETYSQAIGLAFQVIDDILDAEADTATLGKTAGKDADNNKSTYVTILGLTEAKSLAKSLYHHAISQLASYGKEADPLRGLAHFIIQRQF